MPRKSKEGDNQRKYGEAGYPAIERLIDIEDFESINFAFEEAYEELHHISRSKKGFKSKKDIKKVMRSMELTLDLFRELLEIKYRLQKENEQKD